MRSVIHSKIPFFCSMWSVREKWKNKETGRCVPMSLQKSTIFWNLKLGKIWSDDLFQACPSASWDVTVQTPFGRPWNEICLHLLQEACSLPPSSDALGDQYWREAGPQRLPGWTGSVKSPVLFQFSLLFPAQIPIQRGPQMPLPFSVSSWTSSLFCGLFLWVEWLFKICF